MPYLSIIIACYNNQKTLRHVLSRIKQSTFTDFEIIISDAGSTDDTCFIAQEFADVLIELKAGRGNRFSSRWHGMKRADGEVLVNIDSDVLIKKDSLSLIARFFRKHSDVDAITGMLQKEHHHRSFFSQYKNLYMHYHFRKLPQKISFLYGSLYAVRTKSALSLGRNSCVAIADDTEFGQRLHAAGNKIVFCPELAVQHLKTYTCTSFFVNDFQIPHDWAQLFILYKGWQQLGRNSTGYLHASKEQILSLFVSNSAIFFMLLSLWKPWYVLFVIFATLLWYGLNARFFKYLVRERGIRFGLVAIMITAIDHAIMNCGIIYGFIRILIKLAMTSSKRHNMGKHK